LTVLGEEIMPGLDGLRIRIIELAERSSWALRRSPPGANGHFMAGADSIELAEQKVAALQQQIDAFRDLSRSLALDEVRRRQRELNRHERKCNVA
jgi:hypothetical protein